METKIVLFIFSILISFTQSSQNVEKLPNTFSTTYHSPANEVSSSFYFTQNLQSRAATHDSPSIKDNKKLTVFTNHHNGAAQDIEKHSILDTQIHYIPTPEKTHHHKYSLNSLSEQYLPPFKFNSQPPPIQYLPPYFETSTTSPKSSVNNFLYNQYLPSIKSYPTPPSTQYLASSIAHKQQVTPSNQIDAVKIQNPFLISTPFGQTNTKEYHDTNGNVFPINYSKNAIMLSSLENQKPVHTTPKLINSVRSDLGIISTPKPLQFSHAGGTVSHVEFSSADVNYKW